MISSLVIPMVIISLCHKHIFFAKSYPPIMMLELILEVKLKVANRIVDDVLGIQRKSLIYSPSHQYIFRVIPRTKSLENRVELLCYSCINHIMMYFNHKVMPIPLSMKSGSIVN